MGAGQDWQCVAQLQMKLQIRGIRGRDNPRDSVGHDDSVLTQECCRGAKLMAWDFNSWAREQAAKK